MDRDRRYPLSVCRVRGPRRTDGTVPIPPLAARAASKTMQD